MQGLAVERYKSGKLMPWEDLVYLPPSIWLKPDYDRAMSLFAWFWDWLSPKQLPPTRPTPVKVDMDKDIFTFSPMEFFRLDHAVGYHEDKAMQFVCNLPTLLQNPNVPVDHWFFHIKNLAISVEEVYHDQLWSRDRSFLRRMTSLRTVLLVLPKFVHGLDPSNNALFVFTNGGIYMKLLQFNDASDKVLVNRRGRYVHLHELTENAQRLAHRCTEDLRRKVLEDLQHLPRVKIEIVVDTLPK